MALVTLLDLFQWKNMTIKDEMKRIVWHLDPILTMPPHRYNIGVGYRMATMDEYVPEGGNNLPERSEGNVFAREWTYLPRGHMITLLSHEKTGK